MRELHPAVTLLAFLLTATPLSADDTLWNGWRGPARDGQASHFRVPDSWPEKLERGWSVKVGTGYGSPLVAGGRIYQHARQGADEVVWCLDLESGEVIWRRGQPTPFKIGGGAQKHGKGPKSCPVLADGRVFTLSIAGTVTAREAKTGAVLWTHRPRKELGAPHPYWGSSTSPIVDGKRLIVHLGNDERGELTALDVATGDVVWTQGEDGTCYASPLLVEISGQRQVVECNHRALVGVASDTGKLLWEFPFPHEGSNQNMPTPVFHAGRIDLGGENRGLLGLEPRLEDGAWKVERLWHQKKVALDMSTAVMSGGRLFGFSHYGRGRIFCVDPRTGEILWQGPGRTGENVMFLSVPGHVVALLDGGELRVLEASGERLVEAASYRVADGLTWAPPVLLRDAVLIKDLETLTRWSLPAKK